VIISELKSAQLIIKILQEDSKMQNASPNNVDNLKICINQNGSGKGDNDWIEVTNKHHNKYNRSANCLNSQHPPAVHMSNRYSLLANLQSRSLRPSYPHNPVLRSVPTVTDDKMHKILIIGYSHVRGCSDKLVNLLGSSYSGTGISKPNADLKASTLSINIRSGELNKKDLIVWRDD
jgi:hypothetical protein